MPREEKSPCEIMLTQLEKTSKAINCQDSMRQNPIIFKKNHVRKILRGRTEGQCPWGRR